MQRLSSICLHTVFVFADGFDRTSLFARNRHIDNSVIRTAAVADATTDAGVVIDTGLTVFFEADGIFRGSSYSSCVPRIRGKDLLPHS